jgi:hypothetical protein
MTPLSGEGVDAAELALALTENQDSDAAIVHYEEHMFARGWFDRSKALGEQVGTDLRHPKTICQLRQP